MTSAPKIEGHLWAEVAVILSVTALPTLLVGIASMLEPLEGPFIYHATSGFAWSLVWIVASLYVMFRSEGAAAAQVFGLRRVIHSMDLATVPVLFGGMVLIPWLTESAWRLVLPPKAVDAFYDAWVVSFVNAYGPLETTFALVSWASLAFGEELVMRAYLITRFKALLGSSSKAVLVSSTVFASYHVFQGTAALLDGFLIGVWLGYAFLAVGRVWPLAVAHIAYNTYVSLG